MKPKCISNISVVVPPEYWDTGMAILLSDEMAKRASSRGYLWVDLSYPPAHYMGVQIYKRYWFYKKKFR